MYVNSIRALRYADGVVSFELVLEDIRDKKKVLDAVRIDIPYDSLTNINDILNTELAKIGQSHAGWLRYNADRMEGKLPPPPPPKPKPVEKKGVDKPKAGRLIKKV